MDKRRLIDLTNVIYKLTLLFPKKEPLRYKIREVADDILYICLNNKTSGTEEILLQKIEVIDCFLEVAKAQNWVQAEQIFEIQKEYAKLREARSFYKKRGKLVINSVINNKINNKEPDAVKSLQIPPMPERQERIMAFLKEQGRAQVWQIKEILPEVTKRTLRRDFKALLKQGLIERIGERNNTYYQIKTA